MLDYKDIIIKSYALNMSGAEIARQLGCSKSGVNDFLNAFKKCGTLSFPLPEGITNYGIAELVYGRAPISGKRDESFELPDYSAVHSQLTTRKNMTLIYQWNRYKKMCESDDLKYYSYRQFCERYSMWCDENEETAHFTPIIAQTMEVDFAGKTFEITDRLTGGVSVIVVFVAVLPYSQMIYAEGMLSTKEPQWIQVNNNALAFYGGVPALVVCDNCKQAVIVNEDCIYPCRPEDGRMDGAAASGYISGQMCSTAGGTSQKSLCGCQFDSREQPRYGHSSQKAALWRLLTRKRRRIIRHGKGKKNL